MAHLFYLPFKKEDSTLIIEDQLFHHIFHVCRHQEGDRLEVCNGNGLKAEAQVMHVTKKRAEIELLKQTESMPPFPSISLAIPYLKQQERLEEIFFQGAQIGIDHFFLFRADRSQRKEIFDNQRKKIQSIIESGSQVAQRAFLPQIHFTDSMEELFEQQKRTFFGKIGSSIPLINVESSTEPMLFIVGPEGDFSEKELLLLENRGAIGVTITPFTLRAETAAIAASVLLTILRENPNRGSLSEGQG